MVGQSSNGWGGWKEDLEERWQNFLERVELKPKEKTYYALDSVITRRKLG